MANYPTVFIVDDDTLLRESLAVTLRTEGFQFIAFASAEDFLKSYSPCESPACLLLDVRLSGMSGLGLQEELAARNIRIPVIIVTGFGKIPMAVQAMRAGAIDFLEKPFHREALLATIARTLDRDAQTHLNHGEGAEWSSRLELLSPREREVIDRLLAGKSTKQVATALGIDAKTVSKHRARGLDKLQVENIVELARHWTPGTTP